MNNRTMKILVFGAIAISFIISIFNPTQVQASKNLTYKPYQTGFYLPWSNGVEGTVSRIVLNDSKHFHYRQIDFLIGRNNREKQDVAAAKDGVVIFVFNKAPVKPCSTCEANIVVIKHPGETPTYSWYLHLKSVSVNVGDVVRHGQPIGKQGNTGQSEGTHLHFNVTLEFKKGKSNNPDPKANNPVEVEFKRGSEKKSYSDLEKLVASNKYVKSLNNYENPTTTIEIMDNGFCLQPNNDSKIVIGKCNGSPDQQWRLIGGGTSAYYSMLVSSHSKCIDVPKSGTKANSTRMQEYKCKTDAAPALNQTWIIENKGNGYYWIKSTFGMCLDVTDGVISNGTPVQQWTCTPNNTNQLWKLALHY